MSDYLDPVVVELEGRDQKLLDTLNRAKAQVRAFTAEVGRLNATIKVDVKLKDGALAEVRRQVAEVDRITATIKIDAKLKDGALAEVRRRVTEVDRLSAVIKVDAKLKEGALAEVRRRVQDGPAAKLKVDLQLSAGQRDQLRAELESRPIQATVRPVMDQAALRRVKEALRALGRRIDVPVRPQLDDGSVRRAQRRLDRLSANRTVTIRTRVTGDGNRRTTGNRSSSDDKSPLDGGLLKALLPFAPALVPIAAGATAVAAQLGAATVAVGAFGLAVKSQMSSVTGLADAQGKYNQAVAKYGAGSKQAAAAQRALSQTMEAMPAQTLQAAGAFMVLKDDFQNWSNSLAKFTLVPVTQGIGVLDALLPKLSPLVKDTSVQFTRLTTLLAAGVSSGAFDGLMARFTAFTNGVLKNAVDGVIHFARVLSQGGGSGAFSQFIAYAKANAPLVKETLKNLAEAILNILKAASQAGPGMLSLVNMLAKLVAALPPSVVATIMQVAAAIKLLSLTKAGITALAGPLQTLAQRFTALRDTARTAGGGLAGLRAAFASLSTAAKATIIIAAIAAIGVSVAKLASLGQKAPPDIDKLTNSLGRLGQNGQVKGEAMKAFGKNLDDLRDSVKAFVAPSVLDNIQQGIIKVTSFWTTDSTPVKEAKQSIEAIDKALASLVQNGHADLAASALEKLKAAYGKGGHDVTNFTKNLTEYQKAVDDAKFAQELAAQSQGLFGQQALATQKALDAQKASADGLRQSIQALNDVNRAGLGGMIAFNQSLADAAKAAKANAGALTMSHGQLNLNSQKARDAASALQDLADKTDSAAASARDAGSSWETVNGIYSRGRSNLIKFAEQMGLSKSQAQQLADQILKIPDKTARVKMDTEDATRDLEVFNAAVKRAPGAKSVTLKTLSSAAEQVLSTFGFKVTHLKNGSVTVSAKTGGALSAIQNVQGAVDSLHGKTIGIGIYKTEYLNTVHTSTGAIDGKSYPGVTRASGGPIRLAGGGTPAGGRVMGPGTESSDSIPAMLSNGEYVVRASSVRKYGERFLDALNSGKLRVAGFASGGLSQAAKDARSQLGYGVGISYFGRLAGYQGTSMQHNLGTPADLNSLVSSLNDLRGQIKAAFSGRTESSLLKQLDKAGKSLLSYDKQLTKVTASLESAKAKLDDLKNSAAQLKSSVASSIMQGAGVVTQAPQEGFALTAQDVANNMATQVSKALTFSKQLQELKKRGLSADLLEQIASAGVDQGGATAQALVGASDATIKQLNSMQTQLKSSADKAGSAVSDAMYGAGIHAAEGLVKGLEKQQKAIEAAMLKIATSMQAAIKKALGIKSPSTVMAKLGDHTAQGFALGIARSAKHARIAAEGMAMSVQQGATVTGAPAWTASLVGRGGTVVHHHHHFEPHITVEGNVRTIEGLAKDIESEFLKRGMRNSVTYPAYKR